MSWRADKKPGGGYSRRGGRGYRQNGNGENSRQRTLENQDQDSGHRQQSGCRDSDDAFGRRPYTRGRINRSYDGKRIKYKVGKRLKEEDIGVTEFIGGHKRFSGILKERFGDFHVHEVSCDGEICKLTNQDIPPEPKELEDMDKLKESVPSDVWDKLEALTKPDADLSSIKIDVTNMDKAMRRNIHVIAKKIPSVVSETVAKDEKKIIVLAKSNKRMDHKFRGDRRVDWSSREGNYCHFLLHKVNMDTMDALNQLAIKLRIKSDMFNYAGTKDRRARTTQWVSLKKISPSSIHRAAKQVRGAQVGNFKFSKNPLKLGMLNGNRFGIALRSIDGTDEEVDRAMKSLRDNGFINYYGLQRFGTIADIPTHEIGKALLQGNWENAIDLILKPRVGEQNEDMIQARDIYHRTKNASLALRPIARSGKIEAKLLHGIVNSGERNPQGALDHIPRNARLMYIHAYQSFVWNHIVSRRIKEFGSEPIVGDLVYEKIDSKDLSELETVDYGVHDDEQKEPGVCEFEEIEEETAATDSRKEGVNDDDECLVKEKEIDEKTMVLDDEISEMMVSIAKRDEETAKTETGNETLDDSRGQSNLPAVRPLTEEDLKHYTLADVIMPKPGWRVTYPSYAKPWFDEFLAKDDLTTDLRQKNKKYSLGGGYRKILETPSGVSWRITRYSGYHDDLIRSDIDEMLGLKPPTDETVMSSTPPKFATQRLQCHLEKTYGDQAIGYVCLQRDGHVCKVKCKVCPEHRVRNQGYSVTLTINEQDEIIINVECHDCAAVREGKYKALILEFSLKSSTYATMALREILEHDTSAHTQAAQSAANQAEDTLESETMELVAEDEGMIANKKVGGIKTSENAETENANCVTTSKTINYKAESKIVQKMYALGSPEKIAEKKNVNEMVVIEDEENILKFNEKHTIETESTGRSVIIDKAEDTA